MIETTFAEVFQKAAVNKLIKIQNIIIVCIFEVILLFISFFIDFYDDIIRQQLSLSKIKGMSLSFKCNTTSKKNSSSKGIAYSYSAAATRSSNSSSIKRLRSYLESLAIYPLTIHQAINRIVLRMALR